MAARHRSSPKWEENIAHREPEIGDRESKMAQREAIVDRRESVFENLPRAGIVRLAARCAERLCLSGIGP